MSISLEESPRILTVTLAGEVDESEVLALAQAIKTHLASADQPLAIIIDFSASDGGRAKFQRHLGDFFASKATRFGFCAGIAAVSSTPGQDGFMRGILSMGPMPCPYRLFPNPSEAMTWARGRLRAADVEMAKRAQG